MEYLYTILEQERERHLEPRCVRALRATICGGSLFLVIVFVPASLNETKDRGTMIVDHVKFVDPFQIIDLFNVVDSDPEKSKSIRAEDCHFKACFAGAPGYSEGKNYEIMQPVVDALEVCKMKSKHISVVIPMKRHPLCRFLHTRALYTAPVYKESQRRGKRCQAHRLFR